jgi:hypothetical protein
LQPSKNDVNDGPRLVVRDPTWKALIEIHKKIKSQETSITPIIPWTPRDTHHYEKKKNVNGNCPPSCSIRNLTWRAWQQFGAAKQYQGAIACVDT